MRLLQLRDVGLCDATLLSIGRENRRAILRTVIGSLVVQLGGVMRHREENLQQPSVGDLSRVVSDLHRLRVSRAAFADGFILRSGGRTARVTRGDLFHTPHVFEYTLDTPEAATREHSRFAMRRTDFLIQSGRWNPDRAFSR